MSDDMTTVRLVGGPCDGGTLPVPTEALAGEEPGFDFVPEDGRACPPGVSRVAYYARQGEPVDVWHWEGFVP
ncbi:hypothetical protein [Nocardiopsis dassonvillei]|uniref:hypothetical protein n=1 Tax=Nocardiopsis dassonvillei TaxID=2014 RepID=UPI00157DC916|nr:hypothetical protein [Nocardiopsis dassonvillei]